MRKIKVKILIGLMLLSAYNLNANNVTISNVELTDQTSTYVNVKFDIGWDNSWRTTGGAQNWDAVWVFVKYRISDGDWFHATLSNTSSHHLPSVGSEIDAVADGKGVFIYRSDVGNGNNNFLNAKIRWNYTQDGLLPSDEKQVTVLGIEMVYIPQGDYYLGDLATSGCFHDTSGLWAKITTDPVIVQCDDTYFDDTQLEGDGILVDGDDGIDVDGIVAVDNPDYPTGYKSFYIMKYEMSQGQYADFLNLINVTQAGNRYSAGNTGYLRYTISGYWPVFSASAPDRACNILNWFDIIAYMDWAGLRPMTELEFEKACRGTAFPQYYECAWGTFNICDVWYNIMNDGQPDEMISNICTNKGNSNYDYTGHDFQGPFRCGIFAASAVNPSREETGASYYGVMEMSGNVAELCITLGHIDGRNYTGIQGDGILTVEGNANTSGWPGLWNNTWVPIFGMGLRGGNFAYPNDFQSVSDRQMAAKGGELDRNAMYGLRGVRSVP